MTRRVAIYVRVSTESQVDEGYSVGEQTDKLKKYCEIKDWSVYKVYTDGGWSGSNINRPGMELLIKDAKDGMFDTVLVYKLDRLSRSQKDTLFLIEDVFNKNDIAFISLNENFDTSTAFGKAMIGILSVFAQLEREQITERMRMGRIGRAKAGYFKGGPNAPFGYDYVDGELIINPVQAEIVKQVFESYDSGTSLNGLYKELNDSGHIGKEVPWSYRTIRQVLDNDDYIGKVHYLGVSYPGKHDPIVSTNLFEHVQKELKRRQAAAYKKFNNPRPFQAKYMLSGLLRCGVCGSTMIANHSRTKVLPGQPISAILRYGCISRTAKSHGAKSIPRADHCDNSTYSALDLETAVLSKIKKLSANPKAVDRLFRAPKRSVDTKPFKLRVAEIEAQTERFMDLYGSGTISIDKINARIQKLTDEKEMLEAKISASDSDQLRPAADAMKKKLATVDDILQNGSYEDQCKLVKSLINEVDVKYDKMVIKWNLQW